jgi:hypothetical protein
MRRVWFGGAGIIIGLAAAVILWNGPNLYAFADSWHSAESTLMVGAAITVEGGRGRFRSHLMPWACDYPVDS